MKRKSILAVGIICSALSLTGILYSNEKLAFPTENEVFNDFCTVSRFITTPTELEILSEKADPLI